MNIDYNLVKHTALFDGIEENEISSMMTCLAATTEQYQKGDSVYRIGDTTTFVGLVLSGKLLVFTDDFWGNRNILSEIGAGQLFGETYAILMSKPLEVSVLADEKSEILFLDVRRISTPCSSACGFHARLIRNLLSVTARKNYQLTRKLEHMAQRTTRGKLLSYLSSEAQLNKSPAFSIPFTRQQFADYLSVDRSAMSNELSKLRDEGILRFDKNHFELLHPDHE